ncbi:hypothetical protein DL96DRAFT_1710175 [Flagelloscypha sp. PMI_526]|nr:hypothetical protein DL96DRAFT_1710175 [Flagelloscypha sp. PMI_526]
MAILLTGSTGKSAKALIQVFKDVYPEIELVCASRGGQDVLGYQGAVFDWNDTNTFENPFKVNPKIDRIHVVGPHTFDLLGAVKPFLNYAFSNFSIKRVVFLSATCIARGEPPHGLVHQWLAEQEGLEWAVIQPSWFLQNFLMEYRLSLLKEGVIVSAGDAPTAWVDTSDIADATAKALTEETPKNSGYFVVGPEAVTYKQATEVFTEVLGREIKAITYPPDEFTKFLMNRGWSQTLAEVSTAVESMLASGAEKKNIEGQQQKHVGKVTLKEFIEKNRDIWNIEG